MPKHKGKKPKQQQQGKKRPAVIYDTPGHQCAHADKGCCPKCLDPMRARVVKGFTFESVMHSP